MQFLKNPRLLFFINTLPVIVLFFIFFGHFQVIKSMLDGEAINAWVIGGTVLGSMTILLFLYIWKKSNDFKKLGVGYSITVLIFYSLYLYFYMGFAAEELVPSNVPSWMVPVDLFLYVGAFLMPTLLHALLLLVVELTDQAKNPKAWKSFLAALSIPLSLYFFSQISLPTSRIFDTQFGDHIFFVFMIGMMVGFLFFITRSVYILVLKKSTVFKKYELLWKFPIVFIFPIAGLMVNAGFADGFFLPSNQSGVFGDFSDPWFYILAAVNGVLLCLPSLKDRRYRLSLFLGRVLTFPFTFYFFIVFLPFLPLSVPAILAFGTGFLMLTPLLLFVIHTKTISEDWRQLKVEFPTGMTLVFSLIAGLVIPLSLLFSYTQDRRALTDALEYLYSPDYTKHYDVNAKALNRALEMVKTHDDRRDILGLNTQPYLSTFYNWLVLDNMTLSREKAEALKLVFIDPKEVRYFSQPRFFPQISGSVKLTNLKGNSVFDEEKKAWTSWLDIELTNDSLTNNRLAEYSTILNLPTGTFISDYYLYVGDKKEPGILTDKKTATWIYTQIRNQNRDPGILYYLEGNKVAFKVFPFARGEVRRTGIQLIHKEPIKFKVDDQQVQLGTSEYPITDVQESADENVVYIPASVKETLPRVKRQAYFHFIVDASLGKEIHADWYIDRINKMKNDYPDLAKSSRISLVNVYTHHLQNNADWENEIRSMNFEGSFLPQRTFGQICSEQGFDASGEYPVFVVLSDLENEFVMDHYAEGIERLFPEQNSYFIYKPNETSLSRFFKNNELDTYEPSGFLSDSTLLAWPNKEKPLAYLKADHQASVVVRKFKSRIDQSDIREKDWNTALAMYGQWKTHQYRPIEGNKHWLNLVANSFRSRILTPQTSYIVVETEAQKAMIKKKQQQVLLGNNNLDLSGEVTRMSEPPLWWMLGLLLMVGCFLQRRKKCSNSGSINY